VGNLRHPVGPLPSSIYWRRRLVVLGIPLFLTALVAYACTGTSSPPANTAGGGPGGGHTSSASPTGVITPAPGQTASGPPGNSYPGSGGTSGTGGAGGTGAGGTPGSGNGGTGSAGTGQTGQANASVAAAGCSLSLTIALDRTNASGAVQYPSGTYPTFKITASDTGSANCTVDASGRGLVVSVMPNGTTTPVWTSAVCSGAADLRVLGPGDSQTFNVVWKRWKSQGTTCPVALLPTVAPGTYTVNAEANGVTTSQLGFILN